MIEAGHPIPDAAGLEAAERALKLADGAGARRSRAGADVGRRLGQLDRAGAGVSFADKQAVTRALLRSGADIGEINTVRKHLSRIKGGRLARHAYPAKLVTIAISDVPGDDPSAIGSGPTVPDPTTLAEARAIVAKYKLDLPASVTRALADADNEIAEAGRSGVRRQPIHRWRRGRPMPCARPRPPCAPPVTNASRSATSVEGEAREVAAAHAKLARDLRAKGKRAVILSGGELTVTIRGKGRGGPNQEYALGAGASGLAGMPAVAALAGDTDGTDGGAGSASDPAGAVVDGETVARAKALGLDPAAFLADNNSTGFFAALGDLLMPGPDLHQRERLPRHRR